MTKCLFFLAALSLAAVTGGCTARTASSDEAPSAATSEDLTAAKDPVLIANAKAFFQALVEHNDNRVSARIPYASLPGRLGEDLAANNPDPNQEWAAEAYRTRVKNSKGNFATVYGVIDGIDDEGEDITVYTSNATSIGYGDDYRGFEWTK